DLQNFAKQISQGKILSVRLQEMYARELYLAGDTEDLQAAETYFQNTVKDVSRKPEEIMQACCVAARIARLKGDRNAFMKYTSKALAMEGCSEICCELGFFYEQLEDLEEAVLWYYNAVYAVTPVLSLAAGQGEPLKGLIRCYEGLGMQEQAEVYRQQLE
ncbi:MAG: glycosyltransferase family 2 protein, partial [Lachnospiraceae bacterium]|nr:glycosyltransferase family 2 protein [Lachnospiraceae bacterium]